MPDLAVIVNQLAFIDGIGFDPFFRGLLSVLTGMVVLAGGTYLIVATNTGARLGLLISAASFFGWMFLMGIIWTIYGIGWAGQAPTWSLREIDTDDIGETNDGLLFSEVSNADLLYQTSGGAGLPIGGLTNSPFDAEAVLDRIDNGDPDDEDNAATLEAAREALAGASTIGEIADQDLAQEAALLASRDLDIGDWRYLITSDAVRGEAQASADAFLVESGEFETGGFVADQFGAFTVDGKPILKENPNVVDRVIHTITETVFNPTHGEELIVIQVRRAIDQPVLPGQPPPVATPDPDGALVSVIMERDRGGPLPSFFSGLRFTPAMFTLFNGLIFAAFAWNMHLRDQREEEIRTAAAA